MRVCHVHLLLCLYVLCSVIYDAWCEEVLEKAGESCGCSANLDRQQSPHTTAAIPVDTSVDDTFIVQELGSRLLSVDEDGPTIDMIFMEGGNTFIGTNKPILVADGEGPLRTLTLSPYFIDRYSVTNEGK